MGTSISLDDKDLLWLEGIILDRDKDGALKFAEMIKKKIEEQEGHKCGPRI
ncbi:MAG: hypothetical protein AB1478_06145 [Nitrospirota bacterium]